MNIKRLRLFAWVLVGFFLTAAVAPKRALSPMQAGVETLEFGGGMTAFVEFPFDVPFGSTPVVVCSGVDGLGEVVEVRCNAFNNSHATIVAEANTAVNYPVRVNWIATEPTQ